MVYITWLIKTQLYQLSWCVQANIGTRGEPMETLLSLKTLIVITKLCVKMIGWSKRKFEVRLEVKNGEKYTIRNESQKDKIFLLWNITLLIYKRCFRISARSSFVVRLKFRKLSVIAVFPFSVGLEWFSLLSLGRAIVTCQR